MPKESFFSVSELLRDRRKLTVFLICVLLSLLSWILISLGKEYSSTFVVPVRYANFPENKTLLNKVPNQLAVSVSGSGYDLLQFDERLTQDTLEINLDNLKMGVYGDYQRGYLDQAELGKDLQERLKGALAINRVLSDSSVFIFDLKVARILPVKPKVIFEVEQGYVMSDSIHALPAEVEVYGALSVLDTMRYIYTEPISLGKLDRSKSVLAKVSLRFIGHDATTSADSVMVKVPIDQLTEKSFMIEPTLLNVPDSVTLLTFPSSIEVTAQLPLGRYDRLSSDDIRLEVDFHAYQKGYMVLPVSLTHWPTYTEHIQIKPEQVEIVLSRKE
jgi:hypothetical protein